MTAIKIGWKVRMVGAMETLPRPETSANSDTTRTKEFLRGAGTDTMICKCSLTQWDPCPSQAPRRKQLREKWTTPDSKLNSNEVTQWQLK